MGGQTLEISHLILKPLQQKILIENQTKFGGQEVVKASPKEIHQLTFLYDTNLYDVFVSKSEHVERCRSCF